VAGERLSSKLKVAGSNPAGVANLLPSLLLRYATSLRLNSMLLSARLWRVTTVVCAVLALNFLSLWVDRQEWATQLIK
jgi:hypothetical protein